MMGICNEFDLKCLTFMLIFLCLTTDGVLTDDVITEDHFKLFNTCPTQSDPLGLHRVDCQPYGNVTKETCEAQGCCYANDILPDSRAPTCFFPEDYGYYADDMPTRDGNSWRSILKRIPSPSLYGKDVDILAFTLEEQTNNRLRIKFDDPASLRAEVPYINIPNPGVPPAEPLYRVTFTQRPFSVQVIRRSNDEVIFDTRHGALVFSDQFLQLSTHIASTHLYGLGEHLHTQGIKHDIDWKTWTIHAAGKHPTGPEAKNLYGSHPVYLNMEYDGNANMVLLLNQHPMDVVLQPTPAVTFRTIGGILDFYIFLGEWPQDSDQNFCDLEKGPDNCGSSVLSQTTPPVMAIQHYLQAIGLPMMPPYWALGFQLSRWNYTDSEDLRNVINRNREAGIPYDVQWGDVDYMVNAQTFTIDETKYPDLSEIVEDLHSHGQKYIAIHDPGIKTYPPGQYEAYDDGCQRDIWVKHSDGTVLEGKVWPGICVFADYTNEDTRNWWRDHAMAFHKQLPFDGFWIDMNEPSNFIYGSTKGCEDNTWNNPPFLPNITGGVLWDRSLCMDAQQALGRHYDLHSLYGHTMINATHFAGRAIYGSKRFIIVSRSTFVGSGKFAGKWLGDNKSSFRDMKWSITGMIEFNMFGFPYVGADICGFFNDTEEQLCQRWIQLGAFYPMSRSHNQNNTRPQDPASFGESLIKSSSSVLKTRYRLLQYLNTLFHLAHTQGAPVIRPLAFEFPLDKKTLSIDSQFMWGPALLISPVLTNNTFSVRAYIPEGRWYNYFTGLEVVPPGDYHSFATRLDQINLHVRGGHIIPLQKPATTTYLSRQNPLSLLVAYNNNYEAEGQLFWDDGETVDSHLTKDCRIVYFYASQDMIVITTRDSEGDLDPKVKLDSITLYGAPEVDTSFFVLRSAKEVITRQVSNVDWNPQKKTLKLSGLSLDLTQNHYISWLTRD